MCSAHVRLLSWAQETTQKYYFGRARAEAYLFKIQLFNKGIHHPDGIFVANCIIQAPEFDLITRNTLYSTHVEICEFQTTEVKRKSVFLSSS